MSALSPAFASQTDEEERAFVDAMRKLPDFDCYVWPSSWYKKHNIPYVPPMDTREYMKSNYAMRMAVEPKDLPPIIINEPARDKDGNIKLVSVLPLDDVKLEVKSETKPEESSENEKQEES